MTTMKRAVRPLLVGILFGVAVAPGSMAASNPKNVKKTPEDLRADYITRLQQVDSPVEVSHTVGSLWSPGVSLGDLSTDYKARKLNDTIVILISVQTTAAQSGSTSYQRNFQTASGITGLAGDIKTKALTSLFNATSSTALKGTGATDSNTTFQTSLTGQVIAVLPSGNLVVEAKRTIYMNNQHEDLTVRGVVRPGDISTNNAVASSSLSNLEVELKGKGIISDATRPMNPIVRAILWVLGS